MKIWKLISLLLLAAFVGACDDDKVSDDETGGNGGGSVANVEVRFGYEAKTVLKNAGQVLVPVKLAQVVSNAVKVTVDAEKGDEPTDAREGIDFNIAEKVVTIPAGDTVAYVNVDLLDNGKADNNRVLKLNITGVYGGKVGTPKSASLHIVSNAFVEFEKTKWETYESANVETSSEEIRNSRFVPLMITGDLTEAATVVFEVTDGTAVEPTHFTVEKELTVTPGTTKVNVEIKPVDDNEANEDRIFTISIKEIKGGNLLVGKVNQNCEVKIISEEVQRSVAFGLESVQTKDMERTLNIPVFLDKASENDVVVTVGASVLSTAVENEDYIIENKEVTIGSTLRGEVVVKILGDKIENADRKLVLELKDATEKVALSQTAGKCTIDILNNDWNITLVNKEVSVEENTGAYSFKVGITPLDRERKVKLEYETANASCFTELLGEITIPVGVNEFNVNLTVGFPKHWPETAPELSIKFVECDEGVYENPVTAKLVLEPSTYTKLLGSYTLTEDYNGWSTNVIVSSGNTDEEIVANFNKKLVCKGTLQNKDCTWYIEYDPKEITGNVLLHVRLFPETVNFTAEGPNHVVFVLYDNLNVEKIPVVINEDLTKIVWNTSGYPSLGLEENPGKYWSFMHNVVMTRK